MATFWLVAWVMILVAVSFALLPLLRGARSKAAPAADRIHLTVFRDQLAELEADVANGILSPDQLEEGRLELERRLLEETDLADEDPPRGARAVRPILALLIGLALPAASILLYLQLGRIDLLSATTTSVPAGEGDPMSHEQLAEVVEGLANRLAAEPNDPRGWMMLGRSHTLFEDHRKAADAFARAHALIGDRPDVLLAYADSLMAANGGRFDETSTGLVSRAMEVAPDDPKAIWLAGTIAYQQGDYARSLELWERLAARAPAGSDLARIAAANIAETRALARGGDPNRSNPSTAD